MIPVSAPPQVDVQAIMRDIRSRVRGASLTHEYVRRARRSVPGHLASTVGRLRASTALLRSAVSRIGETPPAPPTLRGRIGASMVALIQRVLFWYTPTVQNANLQIVDALESHLKVTEEIISILERTHVEMARMAELAQHEARSA